MRRRRNGSWMQCRMVRVRTRTEDPAVRALDIAEPRELRLESGGRDGCGEDVRGKRPFLRDGSGRRNLMSSVFGICKI